MSTYYYLACPTHERRSPIIGGRSLPDRWWVGKNFAGFLMAHADCVPNPYVVSEYEREMDWATDSGDDDQGESPKPDGGDRGD